MNTYRLVRFPVKAPAEKRSTVNRVVIAGTFAVALVATIGLSVARFSASHPPTVSNPRTTITTTREVAVQRREHFVVRVSALPSTARLVLDGESLAASSVAREFEKNGQRHELRVTAEGFEPQIMSFIDVPPQENIALVPVQRPSITVARPQTGTALTTARTARPITATMPPTARPVAPVEQLAITNTSATNSAVRQPRATNGAQIVEP